MRVKTKRFEVASAVQTDCVRRNDEGRCGPAATRVHLQYQLMARRHFLHLHHCPFAQHWQVYRCRCDEQRVSLQQRSQPGRPTPIQQ